MGHFVWYELGLLITKLFLRLICCKNDNDLKSINIQL